MPTTMPIPSVKSPVAQRIFASPRRGFAEYAQLYRCVSKEELNGLPQDFLEAETKRALDYARNVVNSSGTLIRTRGDEVQLGLPQPKVGNAQPIVWRAYGTIHSIDSLPLTQDERDAVRWKWLVQGAARKKSKGSRVKTQQSVSWPVVQETPTSPTTISHAVAPKDDRSSVNRIISHLLKNIKSPRDVMPMAHETSELLHSATFKSCRGRLHKRYDDKRRFDWGVAATLRYENTGICIFYLSSKNVKNFSVGDEVWPFVELDKGPGGCMMLNSGTVKMVIGNFVIIRV